MRGWPFLLLGACYLPAPPIGIACDPAAPVCPDTQACISTGTGFACLPEGTPPVDAPAADTPPDTPLPPACDRDDPTLRVCFSFDAPVLTNPLANEGQLAVAAQLENVSRIAHGTGGAAQLGDTSSIFIPINTEIVDIVAIEAAIRLDVLAADAARIGVLDADAVSPGMSMFVFGVGANQQLRCNIGGLDLLVDLPVTQGEWIALACRCDNDVISAFANGTKLGETTGCMPAIATAAGLQIGQNGQTGDGLPPNEHLIGAIDDVRLRTAP